MRVWLDNTGFQSVGECLQGTARSDEDIDGLLQFCTFVIFADNLLLNGFEGPAIAERSEQIRSQIESSTDSQPLKIVPETEATYAAACRAAAKDVAFLISGMFVTQTQDVAAIPALSDIRTSLPRHARPFTFSQLFEDDVDLLTERAHGAVKYMLRSNARLREAVMALYAKTPTWSAADTHRLNVFMRYHLNCQLARSHSSMYGPAVARAAMIRDDNQRIIEKLLQAVDESVSKLRPTPLRINSVASALLQRGKGEPLAMIKEAYSLRLKAAPLRKWITEAAALFIDGDAMLFPQTQLVADAQVALEIELGVTPHPGREALQFAYPFRVQTAPGAIADLVKWFRHHNKIAVLTDISHRAAAPYRETEYYYKLRDIAFHNAS